ncbi:unnamed protein product [Chondrus crispus]|uniref:Uncharacterized protein n=1 Tax=Chondrus crispus TaxID=2769 RepID=R7Q633_CHOCR|nr:unnamed protein product [Chondrus crispus]CDF32851.1 unnamed protein product [Chondrus crispus]|eukprot:XP_005712652.1 unnamed protein product [Chondrus crispus]
MADVPTSSGSKPGSVINKPAAGTTNVHKIIRDFQASKATGKFTFKAGRYDRAINLAFGLGMCFVLANVGHGAYQLANGVGKKDGF